MLLQIVAGDFDVLSTNSWKYKGLKRKNWGCNHQASSIPKLGLSRTSWWSISTHMVLCSNINRREVRRRSSVTSPWLNLARYYHYEPDHRKRSQSKPLRWIWNPKDLEHVIIGGSRHDSLFGTANVRNGLRPTKAINTCDASRPSAWSEILIKLSGCYPSSKITGLTTSSNFFQQSYDVTHCVQKHQSLLRSRQRYWCLSKRSCCRLRLNRVAIERIIHRCKEIQS